ncbi:MAG: CBS domain-containing protein, partial [Erysipelothrix sp.]|nr:CBS domain-containing protein [Erysipelothrix sp.]
KVFSKRPIMECLGLMRMRDLNTVVVTDENKKYKGVAFIDDLIAQRDELSVVGELVKESIPTFGLVDDAKDAIAAITEGDHDYVLVLDGNEEVAGIITRGSIARSLTEVVWGDLSA